MSRNINQYTAVGRIASRPNYYQAYGTPMVAFVIELISERFTRADGSPHLPRLEQIPVKVYGKAVEKIRPFLTPGQDVLIFGSIQTKEIEDANGRKHTTFCVLAKYVRSIC